jgi:hypothetical protein
MESTVSQYLLWFCSRLATAMGVRDMDTIDQDDKWLDLDEAKVAMASMMDFVLSID